MTTVVLAFDKHGTYVYETHMACVIARYNEGVYHYGDDARLIAEAEAVINSENERFAKIFLQKRSDWEYEGISEERVIR